MKNTMQIIEEAVVVLFKNSIPSKNMIKIAVQDINKMGIRSKLSSEEVQKVIKKVEARVSFSGLY